MNGGFKKEIEINNLNELLNLMEIFENDIILYRPKERECYEIRIYDDYIE